MIYQAMGNEAEKLLSLPETGMGYQVIESKFPGSYISRPYVVYNSEMIVDLDADFHHNRQKIIEKGYIKCLYEANVFRTTRDSIQLFSRNIVFPIDKAVSSRIYQTRNQIGKGAKEGKYDFADGKEEFVRISAFEDDKRIDIVNNCLRPGSFSTTYDDYLVCISSNDDPGDRYALPNNDLPNWAFYIIPKFLDVLQRGVAQSAFGHIGGGKEIYFEKGTSNNTFITKKEYGKL